MIGYSIEQIAIACGWIASFCLAVYGLRNMPRWAKDRWARAVDDDTDVAHIAFVKLINTSVMPAVSKTVSDALAPVFEKFKAIDGMMVRVEARIPSTPELAGAVKASLPAPPNLEALEARIVARIPEAPDLEAFENRVVARVKAELPDPVDVDQVVQRVVNAVPGINELREQLNSAFQKSAEAIETRLDTFKVELQEILSSDAFVENGKKGGAARRAKALNDKIEQAQRLMNLTEDADELEKLIAVHKNIDRIGKRLKWDPRDIADMKGGLEDLLETRKEFKEMGAQLGGKSGAIQVGVRGR